MLDSICSFDPFPPQSMNDSRALKCRLMKYLIPVLVLSLVMNVTKFFEIKLEFMERRVDGGGEAVNATAVAEEVLKVVSGSVADTGPAENAEANLTETVPILAITDFRINPTYSIYFNWFRWDWDRGIRRHWIG